VTLTFEGTGFVRILDEPNGDPTVNLTPTISQTPPVVLVTKSLVGGIFI
jgi:hypothetical protein